MSASESCLAVGLMSGTSMDGIDAALIRTDGVSAFEPIAQLDRPYDSDFRAKLRAVVGIAGSHDDVAAELTVRHVAIVRELLAAAGVSAEKVSVVGFHGHTVFHDPDNGRTVQIGDGQTLAREVGVDVVADFRAADMAAGGQGAPFAPLFHVVRAPSDRPVCFLNIGGVANLTWIGDGARAGHDDLFVHIRAFDTGPGGALLDDWVYRHTGDPFDLDGRLAAAGRIDEAVLATLLDNDYFQAPPPKSLDRDAFDLSPVEGLSVEDGAATLTAFTARSVLRAVSHLPQRPVRWLVTGGGRKNPTLMEQLGRSLDAVVVSTETAGIDGDAMEAQAFAYLAVRSARGLPLSGPTTTGVSKPTAGGKTFRVT
ncbi:MAG: anhydro-N-acetylmuramic acid kinase [Rhodospirillaceae bacterium]|jgi:anhydro-N-acetylmuramic acid kinase|nr:anhydro-N-acetylmuramic acid kinase [Rhodospirillaceae bacterium]MBT6404162.1 anhydro-N-acetylmuramic acid kinase [Rhodospirillaceae bacterium]MBT6536391.1 anhydro-N-acetylmuramic acid kinase [Rhodospirillaceae bacterium]MBT7362608.1 anhydro-N-acetylmuramic acid kinase [Rhodospirillaceae bacterium]